MEVELPIKNVHCIFAFNMFLPNTSYLLWLVIWVLLANKFVFIQVDLHLARLVFCVHPTGKFPSAADGLSGPGFGHPSPTIITRSHPFQIEYFAFDIVAIYLSSAYWIGKLPEKNLTRIRLRYNLSFVFLQLKSSTMKYFKDH